MKVGTHVFALALLTVISMWGHSGCSQQELVTVTTTETRNTEVGKGNEHARHAEANTDVRETEEHGKHEHHKDHGHQRDEHQHPVHQHHGHQHHGHGVHSNEPPPEARVKVGDKVPDFSVRTLDGKSVQLSELQKDAMRTASGTVVLTFWCSTCHSCRDMEHLLAKLNKDCEGQASVFALAANFDETAEGVSIFLKENGLTFPVVLDPSGSTADLFGVNKTTTTVVIDGNGVLRYCGQFLHKNGGSAEMALKAVLAGEEVAVKTTPHNGCPIMRK